MLDTKNNFRNKYKDLKCRAWGQNSETQEHVLEICNAIHTPQPQMVSKTDLFDKNIEKLKITAQRIENMGKIKSMVPAQ